MKRTVFVGALVGALAASAAFAQSPKGGQTEGHTAPKQQPLTEPAPAAPDGSMALGTVHLPRAVKANGQPLAAGTYQVRLTPDTASPVAKGATASLERWVEFVKGGKVAGREVMTIVPQADIPKIPKGRATASGFFDGTGPERRRLHPALDQSRRHILSRLLRGVDSVGAG
jgi:hypothetical protein